MHVSITANPIFEIGSFTVTNSILTTFIVIVFLFIISFLTTREISLVPKGLQNAFEMGIEMLFNLTNNIIKDKKFAKRIFPLIATFFIFILFNNWFGLIPGVGTIGIYEINAEGHEAFVPILRAGTADLNTTVALGVIVVFASQILGIAAIGTFRYGKKFINFSSPVNFFVGILELVSEITRIISFAFRLFGNVFAGEVLLVVLGVITPYIVPVPFYIMEIFVGFIQALVFTMLALVFFSMATTSHDAH